MREQKNQQSGNSRSRGYYFGMFLRGAAMGTCDVIPGVSGGTIAFIFGIYEKLIFSIRAIGRADFLRAVVQLRLRRASRIVDLPFLAVLLLGILTAVVSVARLTSTLLVEHPVPVWSFFFGLIVASVIVVARRIPDWHWWYVVLLAAATIGTYVLVGTVPATTSESLLFVFVSGALAICAMILPGISGSFILLLLGKYQFIVGKVAALSQGNVSTGDLTVLCVFALGCGAGIVTVAQALSWLFRRFHDITVVVLTGLMFGSLRKVWPWKETVETISDRHGELIPVVQRNVLPALGNDVALAMALAVAGFAVVLLIERVGMRGIGDHV
jgi:putative membrane protein